MKIGYQKAKRGMGELEKADEKDGAAHEEDGTRGKNPRDSFLGGGH